MTVDSLTGGGLIGNALGNNDVTLNVGVANGSGTFTGTITDNIKGATGDTTRLTKLGTGTQVLSGTNIYSGITTVGAGVLEFANTNSLYNAQSGSWTANNFAVSNGATLAFAVGNSNAFSTSNITTILPGLSGSSGKGFLAGSSIGLDTALGNFSLTNNLTNSANGALGLSSFGGNTLTVTGNNSYTGTTLISSGTTLQVGNGGATGTLGSGTITDKGSLLFNRSGGLVFNSSITGSGAVSQVGIGTTTLNGSTSYTGSTTVSAGALVYSYASPIPLLAIDNGAGHSTNLIINGGALTSYSTTIGNNSNSVGFATVSSGSLSNASTLTVGDSGTGYLSITGGTVANNNGYIATSAGSAGAVSISSGLWSNNNLLTVGNNGIGTLSISGNGTVTVGNGSGTLKMGFGSTSTGILNLGDGGSSAGSLLAGSVAGGNGTSTVNVNSTGTTVLGQKFYVSSFNQLGSGTTILAGSNYFGNTLISAGTLQVGNGGTNGTLGGVAVVNNAALVFNRANGINVINQISGSGSLAQNGSGTLTLSGSAKTYTGGTVINSGTLETAGNEMLADSGSVTVNSGGTFKLGGNETIASLNGAGTVSIAVVRSLRLSSGDFSGALNGGGDLYKTGAGVFNFSGTSALTGAIYLQNGTLVAGSTTALNANNYVLMSAGSTFTANQNLVIGGIDQNGGTIDGSGVITAVSTITRSGAINGVLGDVVGYNSGLLKLDTGTTTLGAANTYSGTTKVYEGTLKLGANGSFATNSSAQIAYDGTLDLGSHNQTFADVWANTTIAGSGTMTVTGTLSGSGTITPDTVIKGTHSPGNSPGIQTFGGNLTYSAGAGILLQFTDNTTNNSPVIHDQILVGKNLNFSGLTTLNIAFGDTGSAVDWNNAFWQTSQSWTLYSVSGITTGFDNLALNTTNWSDANGLFFGDTLTNGTFSLALGQNGQDVVLNYSVPEPSTYALMGLGGLALVIAYRRRRA